MTMHLTQKTHHIELTVNGRQLTVDVPGRRLLSDCLRHDLGFTGTHVGCEQGHCGACTVLLDGLPVRSCLMLAAGADGHEITTVEGLTGSGPELTPLQRAFLDQHGFQCGFCTPGILLLATAWLSSHPDPTPDEVREMLAGHLCRCTGYEAIIAAVLQAARLPAPPAHPDHEDA